MTRNSLLKVYLSLLCVSVPGFLMANDGGPADSKNGMDVNAGYILGPGDQISIWALGLEELSHSAYRIDADGHIDVPLIGRVSAGGITAAVLRANLVERLKPELLDPQVTASVTEYRSQPVSVVGAVNRPGVHQLQGSRTLVEALSLAEGPRGDAGSTVTLTRQKVWGAIPSPGSREDASGKFSVAEIGLGDLLDGKHPSLNVTVKPNDVISVARSQTVYVMGEVHKTGAFLLGEREHISVLQAISLAEGMTMKASPGKAMILREAEPGDEARRSQIPVHINRIMSGKDRDVALQRNDILYVASSKGKAAALRTVEMAISVGSGIAIWRVGVPR